MPFYHVYVRFLQKGTENEDEAIELDFSGKRLMRDIVKPFNNGSSFLVSGCPIDPNSIVQLSINETEHESAVILKEAYDNQLIEDKYDEEDYVTEQGIDVTRRFIIPKRKEKPKPARTTDNLDKIEIENFNEKDTIDRLFDNLITHPKINQASQKQFKNGEYRHAVLDAMISLEVMIKEKAKYPADNKGKELSGVALMHKVFDSDNPILSWCKDTRQIDRDELEGYKHIFAGAMQGIRDPKAHAIFQISPMRALKLLTLATLLAELVDASEYVEQNQRNDTTKSKEAKERAPQIPSLKYRIKV